MGGSFIGELSAMKETEAFLEMFKREWQGHLRKGKKSGGLFQIKRDYKIT